MKLQPRIHNFCENSCLSFLCLLQDDLRELDHGHVHYEEMEIREEEYSITEPVTAALVQADTAQADTVQAYTAQANTAQADTLQADIAQDDTEDTNSVQDDTSHADTAQAKTVKTQVDTVSEPTDENIQLVLVM